MLNYASFTWRFIQKLRCYVFHSHLELLIWLWITISLLSLSLNIKNHFKFIVVTLYHNIITLVFVELKAESCGDHFPIRESDSDWRTKATSSWCMHSLCVSMILSHVITTYTCTKRSFWRARTYCVRIVLGILISFSSS